MSNTTKQKPKVAKKILVVEDQGEIGLMLNLILMERKIDLDYVSTLLAADEYLQKHKPSLIILDNKLPDGFGVDFITYIKKKYPSIKIIMISGFPTAREVALANGADMFFDKPFALEEFDHAIDNLLN
jgi:DNA-binding response OmpR family regulator